MANDLVFNMIANSSQFTAGMKQAQKAADSLFLSTATGAEKFAVELENLQRIAHLTNMDQGLFSRAYAKLIDQYDPFGANAREKEAEAAAAAEKQIASDKAAYIQGVIERSKQMEWNHKQQFHQATLRQDAAEVQSAKARTASTLAAERAAAQSRIQHMQKVAAFREMIAEQSGRALIREAQQEARAVSVMQSGGFGGIGGNRAMIVQQLAFAAEDAATQYGTRGLAGAMMAAGNNISFVASMINPMIGVMTSLGLAGGMVLMTMLKINKASEDQAEISKRVTNRVREYTDAIKSRVQFERQLQSIESSGQLKSAMSGVSDELEESYRTQQKLQDNIVVLQSKREDILRKVSEKGSQFNDRAAWYRYLSFGLLGNTGEDGSVGKELDEIAVQMRSVENTISSITKRRNELEQAGRSRIGILNRKNAADEMAAEWKENQEEMRQQAEGMLDAVKTKEEMVAEKIQKIHRLREADKLTQEQALRLEEAARKELEVKEQAQRRISNLLTGAMDIRSAEAFGVIANAQARSMLPGTPGPFQAAPQATAVDKEIEKNGAKAAAVLEKLLHEFGRRPSIPVVGLN